MRLGRTAAVSPRVEWFDAVGSTNAVLRELVEAEGATVPHGTVVATADQTAGRGRAGRGWVMPPGTALAVSVLLRGFGAGSEGAGPAALGPSWAPLLVGSAVTAALQPLFAEAGAPDGSGGGGRGPLRVGVKWPNDVHVRDEADAEAGRPGKKLCGILCEMLSDGSIVAGAGINLLIPGWELPTERATSVLAAGGAVGGAELIGDPLGEDLTDRVMARFVAEMLDLAALAAERPEAARTRVLRHSLTLGAEVRVHLPGGETVDGRAVALDTDGALVVDRPTGGRITVHAADVEHLR